MTALTTEARTTLATAFTGLGYKVYSAVPNVPTPKSIVIIPDTPWILPNRIGSTLSYEVFWKVIVTVSPRNNDAAQLDSENAVDTLLAAIPNPYTFTRVGPPQLTDVGAQGTVITTEINVSVRMKE
ncbi:hypothetical protein UFOVP1213_14 [uncultured Caudovirales phage]|uniref:Uncharacterized protein n=1 Tax=uncultured Caudovirales phage TaxID=2100421 RepID=A0A6J5R231_9CAUD|nr:hypothetical protein UFOVP1213_14 [uncultured Caudovirales phage]